MPRVVRLAVRQSRVRRGLSSQRGIGVGKARVFGEVWEDRVISAGRERQQYNKTADNCVSINSCGYGKCIVPPAVGGEMWSKGEVGVAVGEAPRPW